MVRIQEDTYPRVGSGPTWVHSKLGLDENPARGRTFLESIVKQRVYRFFKFEQFVGAVFCIPDMVAHDAPDSGLLEPGEGECVASRSVCSRALCWALFSLGLPRTCGHV